MANQGHAGSSGREKPETRADAPDVASVLDCEILSFVQRDTQKRYLRNNFQLIHSSKNSSHFYSNRCKRGTRKIIKEKTLGRHTGSNWPRNPAPESTVFSFLILRLYKACRDTDERPMKYTLGLTDPVQSFNYTNNPDETRRLFHPKDHVRMYDFFWTMLQQPITRINFVTQ